MLIEELGYRRPTARELAATLARRATGRLPAAKLPRGDEKFRFVALSAAPSVTLSGIAPWGPLAVASHVGNRPGRRAAWFLLSPTWSIESESVATYIRRYAVLHRLVHPRHRCVVVANTEAEVAIMHRLGEAAVFVNQNSAVSEAVFRPFDGAAPEFDAIYNAQMAGFKRHELTLGIESCAFVAYRGGYEEFSAEQEQALFRRHAEKAPGHVFLNDYDPAIGPVRMEADEVNRQLNRAAVGLALSGVEGSMLAHAEYLLAGLPVVSTPSRGGREVFDDPDYCLTVPADPAAVAEAVAALKAREIPRHYVRRRTLEKMKVHRERFVDLINAILAEEGAPSRMREDDYYRRVYPYRWIPVAQAVDRVRRGAPDVTLTGAP